MNDATSSGLSISLQMSWYIDREAAAVSASVHLSLLSPAPDRRNQSDNYAGQSPVFTKQGPTHPPGLFFDAARKGSPLACRYAHGPGPAGRLLVGAA